MAKNQEGLSLIPTRFQHAEIPISVATLIIDGKRLTSAFYKQITEADLIDEDSGELRGDLLGYFHLHSKSCPEVSHTHVLWATETELHLATVVTPEEDERYLRQEQASMKRREHLVHLLALLLGLADHPLTAAYESERRRKLEIAGYTLYVDTYTADQLQRLQLAREQLRQDQQAWQEQRGPSGRRSAQAFGQQQRKVAEALLVGFEEQGVELKHPARDRIEERELRTYSFYGDEDRHLDGPTSWCRYPASPQGEQREEPLLYWRAKERQQAEQLAPAVAALLPGREAWLLRVLLAERMAHQRMRATREAADGLTNDADTASLLKLGPTTEKTGKKRAEPAHSDDLAPDQVWRSYEREANRFKALAQQWKTHISQLSMLRQLFLLS